MFSWEKGGFTNLFVHDNVFFVSQQLKEETRRGFAGLEDPLAGLLDMLENSSDWKGKGHSLGYYITNELQLWIKEHPAVQQVRERK